MPTLSLKLPDTIRAMLRKRFVNQCGEWIAGLGQWPLKFSLGTLTETDFQRQRDAIENWIDSWRSWNDGGEVLYAERQWRVLGTQCLPAHLVFKNTAELAHCIGEGTRWKRAVARYSRWIERWPALRGILPLRFDMLADYESGDFARLESLVGWVESNPNSNLYPRQLPIAGMDSKWLESRQPLVAELVKCLSNAREQNDFFGVCGLRRAPHRLRMRILDPELARDFGGLSDIRAPIEEVRKLRLPAKRVFIVENIQTGLAFETLPGTVVLMGLGYDVNFLSGIDWVKQAKCFYWGDIDTHGFAILSRAREYVGDLSSLLMDETTLMTHRELWVDEKDQCSANALTNLTDAESDVYSRLKRQAWGTNVRLEQERIAWDFATHSIRAVFE